MSNTPEQSKPSPSSEKSFGEQFVEELNKVKPDVPVEHPDRPHGEVAESDLDRYSLQFLGKGGEHVVFSIPDHPQLVAKANIFSITNALENANQLDIPGLTDQTAQPGFELTPQLQRQLAAREQLRLAQLGHYFGKEHIPNTKRFVLDIPISKQLVDSLKLDQTYDRLPEKVTALVSLQKRLEISEDSDTKVGLAGGYPEKRGVDSTLIDKANETLIYGNPKDLSKEEFLQMYPMLTEQIGRIDRDEQLKKTIGEFVKKAIAYTKETGDGLDIVGGDNVYFTKDEHGNWDYQMPDAISMRAKLVEDASNRLEEIVLGRELNPGDSNVILNAINYVRTINWLAGYLGLEDKIDMLGPQAKRAHPNIQAMM
jgi:hypothetical protein